MNKEKAFDRAIERAKQYNESFYVVLDDPEWGEYAVANELELDTYYLGCPVIATVEPDGMIYSADIHGG